MKNSYSTNHTITASSSWARAADAPSDLVTFGFAATGLLIFNTCGDRLFWNFESTRNAAVSTNDAYISGCSALALNNMPPFSSIQLLTTSSSCTARPNVTVSAWR